MGIVLNFPDLIQQKVPGGCLASYIIHSLFIIFSIYACLAYSMDTANGADLWY